MELKELKEKYPDGIYEVNANAKGKVITFYLKDFDRHIYSACNKIMKSDELEAVKVAIKNLWVGGEPVEAYLEDFRFLRSCTKAVVELLQIEEVTIKKI